MLNDKREAVCRFIRENQNDLYRFAYSYIKNSEDALDIVQESIVKALEAAYSLKNIESIKPWIFRIIVNEANNVLKRNKRYVYAEYDETYEIETEYIDDMTAYINRQEILKSVFALKDKYRVVIVLRYYEELKINEISKVLGISENTVKTRLYKALKILKETLEKE